MELNPVDFRQKLLDVYSTKGAVVSFLRTVVQPEQRKGVETACNDLWMILGNPGPPCTDITDLFTLLPEERSKLGLHVITSSTVKTLSTLEGKLCELFRPYNKNKAKITGIFLTALLPNRSLNEWELLMNLISSNLVDDDTLLAGGWALCRVNMRIGGTIPYGSSTTKFFLSNPGYYFE